ncbi:MAG: hypothetical protein GVY18_03610 [Bacteroidetes bacterium]|jgi:hypothetical protein|nr:hypothetical protein [Bacteroidota bacterium]
MDATETTETTDLIEAARGLAYYNQNDRGAPMGHAVGSLIEDVDAGDLPPATKTECVRALQIALLEAGCDARLDKDGTLRSWGAFPNPDVGVEKAGILRERCASW